MNEMIPNNNYYSNQYSKRLLYRKLSIEDIDAWKNFFVNNEKLNFIGISELKKSPEDYAKEWIDFQLKRYENNDFGQLALIDIETKEFIGVSGVVTRLINENIEYEITYSILPFFWRMGFATEAASYFTELAQKLNVSKSIISLIHPENFNSINVATKNGFKPNGMYKYLGIDVVIYRKELTHK